jgi:hypothetical protein
LGLSSGRHLCPVHRQPHRAKSVDLPRLTREIARGALLGAGCHSARHPRYLKESSISMEVKLMEPNVKPETGSKYKTGDKSPVSGTFVCADCERAGKDHRVNVSEGQAFPQCQGMDVTWRLEDYT